MKHPCLTIGLTLLCLSLAWAQGNNVANPDGANAKAKPAAAKAAADQGDQNDNRVIIEHVDTLRYDPTTKTYYLRGNVVFAHRDLKLYCDEADYNSDADTAVARGHLRVTSPDSVITGDLIEADFGKELTIITGHVTIITQKKGNKPTGSKAGESLEKPGKKGGSASGPNGNQPTGATGTVADKPKGQDEPERLEEYWEKKTTITCERVEYYYSDDVKKMTATPRVKAVQEDKTVWADTAVYEDIPRLITLTGNVVLTTDKGDEMRCAKAVVSVDEDWIQAERISGVTLRKKKDEGGKPTTPPPPGTEQPAPAAAPAGGQ